MPRVMVLAAALVLVLAPVAARAELATERYAPAQLRVAQDLLERARARAALGDAALAAALARQARFDAELARRMSESPHLHDEAAEVVRAARALSLGFAGLR